mmetsp:Transcript_541/g.1872  ORF Transcript_541/g.1872 Transcript_541/m.1872 type:complete len:208 (-) Transcript_541:18-641(-)
MRGAPEQRLARILDGESAHAQHHDALAFHLDTVGRSAHAIHHVSTEYVLTLQLDASRLLQPAAGQDGMVEVEQLIRRHHSYALPLLAHTRHRVRQQHTPTTPLNLCRGGLHRLDHACTSREVLLDLRVTKSVRRFGDLHSAVVVCVCPPHPSQPRLLLQNGNGGATAAEVDGSVQAHHAASHDTDAHAIERHVAGTGLTCSLFLAAP